jgi:hypothetical protein
MGITTGPDRFGEEKIITIHKFVLKDTYQHVTDNLNLNKIQIYPFTVFFSCSYSTDSS